MANFAYQQADQMYVVPATATVTSDGLTTQMVDTAAVGSLNLRASGSDVWFEYMSPNAGMNKVDPATGAMNTNGIVRTDLIPKGCVTYIDLMNKAANKTRPTQRVKIALDPDIHGTPAVPIVGERYMFRVRFFGLGVGGTDVQYTRNSSIITANATMTPNATTLYKLLSDSFNKSISHEPEQWVISTSDADGIYITAIPRPFSLGRRQGDPLQFEASVSTVSYYNQDYPWGLVTDDIANNTAVSIKNGRKTASMEYFFLGERGDQYREWAWPVSFDTKYLADINKTYDFINIEYFYAGDAEDVIKSKAHLMIAIDDGNTGAAAAITAALAAALGEKSYKVNGIDTAVAPA